MKKMTVRFQVETTDQTEMDWFEIYLNDLLKNTVFPTLKVEMVPLSLEVKKARN